ncbi:sushi, von Willebrand factor type A, EGF and pentraxin domain-containing protein 1-like [Gigantopelta aegis]|uniref:sushi, von Willebrand factor type A, EGF and pentraxin domain-containing protein 1-like n=1 Tax=Gigantopelta aegis TaxID=1735272 RepID=UPI001B8876ED|nr:sushi, von Willebrand factor type A, EGF and pentraxin domain-containing protein 1-like [Gigantopelta aegis]
MLGILLFFVLGFIDIGSPCTDIDPPSVCLPSAADGGCYWNSTMNCRCINTCHSTNGCPNHPTPGDGDCFCQFAASSCPGISSYCQATCNYRSTVVCAPPEVVPNAVPSSSTNFYMDKITYSCDIGYEDDSNGFTGHRLCTEKGTWLLHPTEGVPPNCSIISCGTSPVVPRTSQSQTTGVYGDTVTYTCNYGHVDPAANTGFHNCNATGDWVQVGTLPSCQLVTCAAPDSVSNATPNKTSGIYGDVIYYSCDVGYEISSGNIGKQLCNSTGQWVPDSTLGELPVCKASCGSAPSVVHATPSSPVGFAGDTVHYLCDVGFRRVSGDIGQTTCNESRSWVSHPLFGDPPVCQEIVCGTPPVIMDASANQTSGKFGDVIVYTCNTGFSQTGGDSGQMFCNESGLWTESTVQAAQPICQIITCGAPPGVSNASPSQNSGNYGDIIHYLCDVGNVQTGGLIGQMSCDASGSWVADSQYGEPPTCGRRPCESPPPVPLTNPNTTFGYYGDAVVYTCSVGYTQTAGDNSQMVCNQLGMWTLNPPTGSIPLCTVVSCPAPSPVTNASPSVNSGVYGDSVHYLCDAGYRRVSGNIGRMTCDDAGKWKVDSTYGEPPLCEGVSCGTSPAVPNASANQSSGVFGDVIQYQCNVGYVDYTGNVGRMTCNSSALWDPNTTQGAPPDCQVATTTSTTSTSGSTTTTGTTTTTPQSTSTSTSSETITPGQSQSTIPMTTEDPVKDIPVYKKYKPPVHEAKGAEVFGGFAIIILSLFGLSIVLVDLINIKQHIRLATGNFREVKAVLDEKLRRSSSYDVNNDDKSRKDPKKSEPENKTTDNVEKGLPPPPQTSKTQNGDIGKRNIDSESTEMRPRVGSTGSVPRRQPEVMRPRLGSAGARVSPAASYPPITEHPTKFI